MQHYMLNEQGEVVECDFLTWAKWFENVESRVVKATKRGDTKVSTIFLGLDHSFGDGPPILWETMVFQGKHWNELLARDCSTDVDQERHATLEEALACHKAMVKKWLG